MVFLFLSEENYNTPSVYILIALNQCPNTYLSKKINLYQNYLQNMVAFHKTK